MKNPDRLISHLSDDRADLPALLQSIESRLRQAGDAPGAPVAQQIEILHALASFELGRFLLANRGLDAYWTQRVVTYRADAAPAGMGALERRVFEQLPAVLATRERFGIFRQQLQALLRPGIVMASVPCGVMGDLLSLDYSGAPGARLLGIDLDPRALEGAQALAAQAGLAERVSLRRDDAWAAMRQVRADVLTSNGLNIYEPDDARVTALYRSFFESLNPGGTLVTSFLTPPPPLSAESPWKLEMLDKESLALQHLLFVRIIEAKWSAYRTHAQTLAQLQEAGFTEIVFIDDRAHMFPTVLARKAG